MKRLAIVFTGGTISMQPDPVAGGNRPSLDGAAILALAPGVARVAAVEAVDWGLVPASHLRFGQLLDLARVIQAQVDRADIDGVVVVQGTDTIEETAFAFDLLIRSRKPVVVTGAMRDAASAEYDGPRNLIDAVGCAANPDLGDSGVVVVLGGAVIGANQAVKAYSSALDAFEARDGQPVGQVSEGVLHLARDRDRSGRRAPLEAIPEVAVDDVFLITAVTGMDGALIRGLAPLRPRGLVVAATGAGNTHPDALVAAQELMAAGTTVCLTTRCPHGTVDPIYAFPGGGVTWKQAGALLSMLDGPKSRVALCIGLAGRLERDALAALLSGEPGP